MEGLRRAFSSIGFIASNPAYIYVVSLWTGVWTGPNLFNRLCRNYLQGAERR